MKLSVLSLLLAATTAYARTDYTTNFDKLERGKLTPNPLRELLYSDEFQIGTYAVQASNANAKSKKLLFSGPGAVGKRSGRIKISPESKEDRFTLKKAQLGCSGKKTGGKKKTVPCELEITGMRPSQNFVSRTVKYTDTKSLLTLNDLEDDLWGLYSVSFKVVSAGKGGDLKEDVTLLVDSLEYYVGDE
ncbi:hypothetical protein BDW42DRAFT_113950 [Aspergillus taichungensis]|uniref:Uncharacterized protein n=1 Tax=Aspergillus taichungensis TaxID=482145 RepID=A0A2J5HSU4_9EURO|nr:hypothetical protein BDW42DRAFT_113950 [Aspergillus taichungensis]